MQNQKFKVSFHAGGIRSIVIKDDPYKMNWIKPGYALNTFVDFRKDRCGHDDFVKKRFQQTQDTAEAIFRNLSYILGREENV